MIDRLSLSRSRCALLFIVGLLMIVTAACASAPAGRASATAPSVQDQLAQLAGASQPNATATLTAAVKPSGTHVPTTTVQPPRTRRPTATIQPTRTHRPTATIQPTRTRGPAVTVQPTRTRGPAATATPPDGLGTVTLAQLPSEARETIRLIQQGGPFPYDKDGATFGNRERLLPKRPNGYYQEYTVITPGSRDRGARRIVAGRGGELYYTDDHYDSFKRVLP